MQCLAKFLYHRRWVLSQGILIKLLDNLFSHKQNKKCLRFIFQPENITLSCRCFNIVMMTRRVISYKFSRWMDAFKKVKATIKNRNRKTWTHSPTLLSSNGIKFSCLFTPQHDKIHPVLLYGENCTETRSQCVCLCAIDGNGFDNEYVHH